MVENERVSKGINGVGQSTSRLLVEAVNKNVKYKSSVTLIMKDCVSLMKEIMECNLCFVRRSTNKATHCLA